MFKKIALAIIPLFLFFLQTNFFSAVPGLALRWNVLVVYCILALLLTNVRFALLNALFFGILTDLYAIHSFGISTLSFCIAVGIADIFFQQFFTNKSIYSFIVLMALATLCFLLVQALLIWGTHFFIFNPLYAPVWTDAFARTLAWQTLGNTLLAAVSFYPINYFSQKLKPFLLQQQR
jgi:cell shape-determining protein MreD